MAERFLDAGEIAHVAHDAVYRAWFRLGGSIEMLPWDCIGTTLHDDARYAVSSRMRSTYQNERYPTTIPAEYAEFWRVVVDSAIRLKYDDLSALSGPRD